MEEKVSTKALNSIIIGIGLSAGVVTGAETPSTPRSAFSRVQEHPATTATIQEFAIPTAQSQPYFIDVDANGTVWFAEKGASKIGRFNPVSNTFTEFLLSKTTNPTEVICSVDRAIVYFLGGPSGNAHYGWIVPSTGAVYEFRTGLPSSSATTGALDPAGNFWFNGWDSQSLVERTRSGQVLTYALPYFGYSDGLTRDPQGNIWLTIVTGSEYNPTLLQFNPALGVPGTSNGFTVVPMPASQACIRRPSAALGRIWFPNEGDCGPGVHTTAAIESYEPSTGQWAQYLPPTPDAAPGYPVADRWGRIWFAEGLANQIGMLDLQTGTITEFPVPTANSNPAGIAVDVGRDIVWFSEFQGNKIGKLTLR